MAATIAHPGKIQAYSETLLRFSGGKTVGIGVRVAPKSSSFSSKSSKLEPRKLVVSATSTNEKLSGNALSPNVPASSSPSRSKYVYKAAL